MFLRRIGVLRLRSARLFSSKIDHDFSTTIAELNALIWVYGNSFESFLVAVANPNKDSLELWAEVNGVAGDFPTIGDDPKAKAYILGELTKVAKENKLKGFEFIKAVHLDPIPFDMDRDLLTPTYKKKWPQFLKYYKNVIDDMYNSKR